MNSFPLPTSAASYSVTGCGLVIVVSDLLEPQEARARGCDVGLLRVPQAED